MAIYRRTYGPNVGTYNYVDIIQQDDALLYGSKRLGNWHGGRLKQRELNSTTTAMTGVTYGSAPDWTNGQGGYPATALSVTRELGLRHYELSNHLGNVLSTVSDRRLAMGSGSLVAYYRADEKSYADYDPYGMLLPGRLGGGFADQNFGFQGQLKDDQLHVMEGTSYAFEYRVHDPRVGRFLSIDPLQSKYPWNSSYAFCENRTIDYKELEGLEGFDTDNETYFNHMALSLNAGLKNFPRRIINTIQLCATPYPQFNSRQEYYVETGTTEIGQNYVELKSRTVMDFTIADIWWSKQSASDALSVVSVAPLGKYTNQLQTPMLATRMARPALLATILKSLKGANVQYECVPYADDFMKRAAPLLREEGAKTARYQIDLGLGGRIGTASQNVTLNGKHQFMVVSQGDDLKVFDNLHPEGMPFRDYWRSIQGSIPGEGTISGENLFLNYAKPIE
jgi:RHS repeat-associated protein